MGVTVIRRLLASRPGRVALAAAIAAAFVGAGIVAYAATLPTANNDGSAAVQKLVPEYSAAWGAASPDFGKAVAISGNVMVVGAPSYKNATGTVGAVYIYTRSGGTWTSTPTLLLAPTPTSGECFGHTVAIAGDTLAISTKGINPIANQKSTYLYTGSGGSWTYTGKKIVGATTASGFNSLALADDAQTLVIGDYTSDKVTVCSRTANSSIWDHTTAALTGVNGLGYAVDIEGTLAGGHTLAVGAWEYATTGGLYVYTGSGASWTRNGPWIQAGTPGEYQYYGQKVVLSGDTIAVSAAGQVGAAPETGAWTDGFVTVFRRTSPTTWALEATLKPAETVLGDHFGSSLALVGDTLVVGAPYRNGPTTADTRFWYDLTQLGAVYSYQRSGATWSLAGRAVAPDAATLGDGSYGGDRLGWAVAMDPTDATRYVASAPWVKVYKQAPTWGATNGYTGAVYDFDCTLAPASLFEDTTLSIPATSLLANDTDPEGDPLTAALDTQPAHGTVTYSEGQFTYDPDDNYFGTDSFTYRASDGSNTSGPATVYLTVTPINDRPTITSETDTLRWPRNVNYPFPGTAPFADASVVTTWFGGFEGGPYEESQLPRVQSVGMSMYTGVNGANPATNITFPTGSTLTPTVYVGNNGAISFGGYPSTNPGRPFLGTYQYNVVAGDDKSIDGLEARSLPAVLTIELLPDNLNTAVSDSYSVIYGESLTVSAADGVLKNDLNDGDTRIVRFEDGTSSAALPSWAPVGTLALGLDGSLVFTPTITGTSRGTYGGYSAKYRVFDGYQVSPSGPTVQVNVGLPAGAVGVSVAPWAPKTVTSGGVSVYSANWNTKGFLQVLKNAPAHEPPAGFDWVGDDYYYVNLAVPDSFTPGQDITFPVTSSEVTDPAQLQVVRWNGTGWDELTTKSQTVDSITVAVTTRPEADFALVQPTPIPAGSVVIPASGGPTTVTHSGTGISLTFSSVSTAGYLQITRIPPNFDPPANFKWVGSDYYDIHPVGTFTYPVTIELPYNPAEVTAPGQMKLFHWSGTGWENVTTSVDTVNYKIHASTDSFSDFGSGEPTGSGDPVAMSVESIWATLGLLLAMLLAAVVRRRRIA